MGYNSGGGGNDAGDNQQATESFNQHMQKASKRNTSLKRNKLLFVLPQFRRKSYTKLKCALGLRPVYFCKNNKRYVAPNFKTHDIVFY